MYATEFQTVAKEPYIKIPEFEKFKDKEIKVVILTENLDYLDNEKKDDLDFFDKYQFDLSNFKFDREEANER